MSDWNEALCYHDVRNPNHVEYLGADDSDPRQPGCSCDNCFYGRDKLALTGIALKAERDALRAALADMLAGWLYIQKTHGDLYGVGWERAQKAAEDALKEPTP